MHVKDVAFTWDGTCQQAFEELKECLISAPVLAYPQFKSDVPFVLETDASIHGLGAVLAQTGRWKSSPHCIHV